SGTFNDTNGDGNADVGETITYTFTVTNTGNVTLFGVTVTDPIITVSGGPLSSLAPGDFDSTTFTGTYVVTQADIGAGHRFNLATTTGTAPDESTVTDDDDNDTPLPQAPLIELQKSGTFN